MSEHLTQEERGEGDVQHDALVQSLTQHLTHKLEQQQVVLMEPGRGGRVQALVPTGRLDGREEEIKTADYRNKGEFSNMIKVCVIPQKQIIIKIIHKEMERKNLN